MFFRQVWVMAAVVLTLVGVGLREPGVAAVGILILLTGGLAHSWNKLGLERVQYRRIFPGRRAFVGETVEVAYHLVNRKLLPVPWIDVRDNVPEGMPIINTHTSPSGWAGAVSTGHNTSLAWYERVIWRHSFRCETRGFYRFGPALLRSGDPFGFFDSSAERTEMDYMVVLPRLYELSALGLPTRRPFGEVRGGSPIFEDPSRLVGVRDYRVGDPLKRIEWKATARRGTLQSRVYEPSSALHLLVALNVSTLEFSWEGYDPVKLERSISLAGTVARWAHESRYAVGLLANSTYPSADRAMSIPAGRDPDQLTRILEALAMISPLTIAPLEDVLEDAARRLPLGATIVLVAALCPERLSATLHRLHARGHPLAVLWVADEPPPALLADLNVTNLATRLRELERAAQGSFAPEMAAAPNPEIVRE